MQFEHNACTTRHRRTLRIAAYLAYSTAIKIPNPTTVYVIKPGRCPIKVWYYIKQIDDRRLYECHSA